MYWRFVLIHLLYVFIENFNSCYFLARGNISQNSSGVLVALIDQAQQLDPDANPPVVALETSKK